MIRRRLTIAALAPAAGYLALLGLLFFGQRALLFPRPRQARPAGRLMQHLEVADALGKMPALYRPPAEGKPVIAFFHGNGGQLADAEWLATQLSPTGLGVFSVDDEVVPYELGLRLSTLFPHCTLITLSGAHHNDVIDRADVLKQIVDFALGSP